MTRITDFQVLLDGEEVAADPFGNNVAFKCNCGHPVLAIARDRHRGSHKGNPAECRKCKKKYIWMPITEKSKKVRIRLLDKKK